MCTKFQLVKYFFESLNNLAASFIQSTKRTKVLDEFLQRRLPYVCPTRWNNATRLVNTVHKKLDDLRLVFDLMLNNAIDIPSAVLTPISGHLANLENFKIFDFTWLCSTKFILWPMFFFIPSEIVVWHFKLLDENWPDFDTFYAATERDVGTPRHAPKKYGFYFWCSDQVPRSFYEIIDTITQHMQTRFSNLWKFDFWICWIVLNIGIPESVSRRVL